MFAGFGVCFAFVFAGFVGFLLVVDMFCCCCWFCRAVCLLFLLGCEVEGKKGKELSRWKHEETLGAAGHAPTAECGHS